MKDELLASIEREVLGWPGVSKDPDRPHVAIYRFERRQRTISDAWRSHVPEGHPRRADLGRPGATPQGRLPRRLSYRSRPEDVPGAVDRLLKS